MNIKNNKSSFTDSRGTMECICCVSELLSPVFNYIDLSVKIAYNIYYF